MNTAKKGRELQRLARAYCEAKGARVETAPNIVRWIKPNRSKGPANGPARPISTHHDFFGCMDLLVLWPDGRRSFYQVTVLEAVSTRRAKILSDGFPASDQDAILGYKGGRDRHFRVFPGPTFETWNGECWRPVNADPR